MIQSKDVEAQKSSTIQTESPTPQQPPEYAHSGRGGAGNWYSPGELEKQGTFVSSDRNLWRIARPTGQNHTSVRFEGRGGAGNVSQGVEAEEKWMESEGESRAAQVTEKVMKDLESALPPPRKAYLAQDTLRDGSLSKAA